MQFLGQVYLLAHNNIDKVVLIKVIMDLNFFQWALG
jgi:hypothetical protein